MTDTVGKDDDVGDINTEKVDGQIHSVKQYVDQVHNDLTETMSDQEEMGSEQGEKDADRDELWMQQRERKNDDSEKSDETAIDPGKVYTNLDGRDSGNNKAQLDQTSSQSCKIEEVDRFAKMNNQSTPIERNTHQETVDQNGYHNITFVGIQDETDKIEPSEQGSYLNKGYRYLDGTEITRCSSKKVAPTIDSEDKILTEVNTFGSLRRARRTNSLGHVSQTLTADTEISASRTLGTLEIAVISDFQKERQNDNGDVASNKGTAEGTLSHQGRVLYTMWIGITAAALGSLYSLITASFLDLMLLTNTDYTQGALIYALNSVGYTGGSIVSGHLYDRFNKDIIIGISAVLAGVFMIMVPLSTRFPAVVALLFASNLFQGTLDSGCTLLCAMIWRDGANPYQQALNLFYALGGVLTPFITGPFLVQVSENNNTTEAFPLTNNVTVASQQPTMLYAPYTAIGLLSIASSLPFLVIFAQTKPKCNFPQRNQNQTPKVEPASSKNIRKYVVAACILLAVYFMAYGYVFGLGEFSMPFSVDFLGWSKTEGTRLNSALWAAMAGGCFIGMFAAKLLRPSAMIVCTLIPVTAGLIALLFVSKTRPIIVWVSYVAVFAGTGSLYPSAVSWVDQRLMRVNGKICSIFTVSGCLGDITNVLLVGYLFQHYSPMWLVYLTLGSSGILWITTFILFRTNRWFSERLGSFPTTDEEVKEPSVK